MDQIGTKPQSRCRSIDVFIFNGVNLLDVAGPVQAFSNVDIMGEPAYQHRYLSLDGAPITACCGMKIQADGKLDDGSQGHDLLIPGGEGVDAYLDNSELISIISDWHQQNTDNRIISICSGALLLAASGLLDGKEATTHWARGGQVENRFPLVDWNLDKIFIGNERIFTSAGVTTGIDLALSIIGQDWGAKIALNVAQELVIYLKRNGGQSQFSSHLISQYQAQQLDTEMSPNTLLSGLNIPVLSLIKEVTANPQDDWTTDSMAAFTKLNAKTLSRRFQSQLSMSPVDFVEQVRLDKARKLLTENHVLKQVARKSGFGDVQRMRRAFKRNFGVTLQDYVKSFG